MNIARPKCATLMPMMLAGSEWPWRQRLIGSTKAAPATQNAAVRPTMVITEFQPYTPTDTASARTTATISSTPRIFLVDSNDAFFHAACMPGASRNTIGSIGTRNIASKYGGPTDTLSSPNASMNIG